MAFYTGVGTEVRFLSISDAIACSRPDLISVLSNKWPNKFSPNFKTILIHGQEYQIS